MKVKNILCLPLFFVLFTFSASSSFAATSIVKYDRDGNYSLDDFKEIAVNVSKIILGTVGSLALLFFVYGGVSFLISAGSQDKVQKAKTILTNATIGLAVVLLSWLIVRFVLDATGSTDKYRGLSFNVTNKEALYCQQNNNVDYL